MKRILVIIIAAMVIMASCRSTRSAGTEQVSPSMTPEPALSVKKPEPAKLAPAAGKTASTPVAVTEEAADHVWDFRDATTWVLGDINPARFMDPPHSSWYLSGYKNYQPDQEIMKQLREVDIDDYSITIVLGTWCPDSRREVPHFMKIVDLWGFPENRIRFIGVDINKVAPLADYQELGIDRVPTFIFYENKSEKGRIIEVPVTSLEQDTRIILTGK